MELASYLIRVMTIFNLCPSGMDFLIIILMTNIKSPNTKRDLIFSSFARESPHNKAYSSTKVFDSYPRLQMKVIIDIPL
jgi:hypothetical protein